MPCNSLKHKGFTGTTLVLAVLLFAGVPVASAADIEDNQTIGLYTDETPVVATSPIPRPTSKIAENLTVITADDIVRLNAHTLAEVLQTVPGIQLDFNPRTPGNFTFFNIQGASNATVLVLIDGIRQNDFDQDIVSPGQIPVQQIERIEIIKGASSGSWGSALGGVINIVTKSGNGERAVAGLVSQAIGGRFTADSRAELSGSKAGLGYYLTGGHLRSDGLAAFSGVSQDNLYGKLSYLLPGQGTATLGLSRFASSSDEGSGTLPGGGSFDQSDNNRRSYGFLKFQQPFAHKLNLDIHGYLTDRDDFGTSNRWDPQGLFLGRTKFAVQDETRGVNGSLSWGDSLNNVVVGGEYRHVHAHAGELLPAVSSFYDRSWDSFAAYLNGSASIGRLAILPGVRFDSTGRWGDETSYTLGLTYRLTDDTTLRAYAARGFTLPMLAFDTGVQKVRTVQAGVETGAVPYLWLKGTWFFNALRNAESLGSAGSATSTDQDRQGFELEARTTRLFGFSLAGGYTYLDAHNVDTDQSLQTNSQQTVPPHVYKLALDYDDPGTGLSGVLTGSGVAWNAASGYIARAKGMVWDLNLAWKPAVTTDRLSPELFFTAHNLFDGIQTTNTISAPSVNRWFEGGARVRF